MARETEGRVRSNPDLTAATLLQLSLSLRWSMQSGSPTRSRFRVPARQGWSARDFRARNIQCVPSHGWLSPLFHPTSGSQSWKICLLLDETAHAHPSQFALRLAEPAAAAVRPP